MSYKTGNSSNGHQTAVGFSHWLMILESVGLAIILVGSVILNSATCVIISRDSALRRKPTNLLVANLCVANMVLTVGVIPFSLISLISDRHGTFLGPACTTNGLFSVASCGAIVLTLCCISIDRYIAVCKPVRYRTILTPRRALLMILITWIQAFLYGSLPVLGWSRYEYHPGTLHCSPAWTDGCSLYIFLSTTGFAIPLTVMAVTYTRIFLEIRKHSRKINMLQMRAKFPAQEEGASVNLTLNGGMLTLDRLSGDRTDAAFESGALPGGNVSFENSSSSYTTSNEAGETQTETTSIFGATNQTFSKRVTRLNEQEKNTILTPTNTIAEIVTMPESNPEGDQSKSLAPPLSLIRASSSSVNLSFEGQASLSMIRNPSPRSARHRLSGLLSTVQATVRTERRAQSQLPREYKVARTGLILLLLFLFHWLPYLVVHSCSTRVDASEGVFHAVMWMVYLNGVVNPVTYALSNSSVKAKLKLLFFFWCRSCKQTQ